MRSLGAQSGKGGPQRIASIAFRRSVWAAVWIAAVAVFLLEPQAGGQVAGQADGTDKAGALKLVRHWAQDAALESSAGEVVREIDDLHTGAHWLLLRNSLHPEGPGRLVMVASGRKWRAGAVFIGSDGREVAEAAPPPMAIHSGERLIVEEHTAVADAALEAVALGPAAVGDSLEVRLKIGGKVLRAVAIAPGRALFEDRAQNQMEVRP